MHDQIAFLSEWGDNALDFSKKLPGKPFASTHFIVTALIMQQGQLAEVTQILEAVSRRHFNGGAINSEVIGNDHAKRKEILEDLDEAPFKVFAVVVDKRQVIGEGLRYKGSFYKFMHGLADRELFRIYPNLQLVAGQVGDDTFMKGFVSYVSQNHISNLFNEAAFGFVGAKDSLEVQAASFMAGTLAYCYDQNLITDQRGTFVEVLQKKLLSIRFWPEPFGESQVVPQQTGAVYDHTLGELSVKLSNDFLQRKSSNPTPQVIDQVTCLGYLLFHFQHINAARYITSFELMEQIRARRGAAVNLHYFQTKVIAPLRDAGVLIASSSRGYKLPASEQDLYDFVSHSNTIIEPMLSRVKRFRDQVHMATNGKIDVLAADEYRLIRKTLD
ncbi:hypothetical protein [Dyadobacter sandarakinus]|uniref:DUF3800 domain-containing protein n=1 Tax=Dyadobacter sandarakinus TaxID=2747268 RepID=A0ABX7I273_9BACT|nr:hypothetical protein [Dyadobacter sandarakinus]QRR00182.1 hypothetical protein HWI92_04330 [Dyadobacter sandarakinus]